MITLLASSSQLITDKLGTSLADAGSSMSRVKLGSFGKKAKKTSIRPSHPLQKKNTTLNCIFEKYNYPNQSRQCFHFWTWQLFSTRFPLVQVAEAFASLF
jgi:hypothetical protein